MSATDRHRSLAAEVAEELKGDETVRGVLLIGSVAREQFLPDSDVDLLTVTVDSRPK